MDPALWSDSPSIRLRAARDAGRRIRRSLARQTADWASRSPGAINAWLVLVTSKPPTWEDTFVRWEDQPLTLGTPHHGFFYPDPLGFWAEVRRWVVTLMRLKEAGWTAQDALSVTALLHIGDDAARLARGLELMQPRVVLFLDEPAWQSSSMGVERRDVHHIRDPHREGQVYEGFWAVTRDGIVVGKSPQHPAAHKLYARTDVDEFLRSAPI